MASADLKLRRKVRHHKAQIRPPVPLETCAEPASTREVLSRLRTGHPARLTGQPSNSRETDIWGRKMADNYSTDSVCMSRVQSVVYADR